MQPFLTYQQFTFSAEQHGLLVGLCDNVRQTLDNNRQHAEKHNYSPQPFIELQEQLAKFHYHLTEEPARKISISTPLLMMFLFKVMERLQPEVLVEHDDTDELARLRDPRVWISNERQYSYLYFLLSVDYVSHHAYVELDQFYAQGKSGEERERLKGTPRQYVNTAGMDEVAVFTALYNAANPQGRGFIQDDPSNITEIEGKALMGEVTRKTYDYVSGRAMKILVEDLQRGYIDVTTYEKYNGAGVAQAAVAHLPRW